MFLAICFLGFLTLTLHPVTVHSECEIVLNVMATNATMPLQRHPWTLLTKLENLQAWLHPRQGLRGKRAGCLLLNLLADSAEAFEAAAGEVGAARGRTEVKLVTSSADLARSVCGSRARQKTKFDLEVSMTSERGKSWYSTA